MTIEFSSPDPAALALPISSNDIGATRLAASKHTAKNWVSRRAANERMPLLMVNLIYGVAIPMPVRFNLRGLIL